MKLRLLSLLLVVVALGIPAVASNAVRPAHGAKAMVATVQPEASKAGVAIMQQGGNAVDAAVAVGFALAVVYPEAGNIGGGGFMLFRRPDGEVHFLDYREKAPAKATANMYLDSQGNVIPDMSTIGYKAIGVPGSVAGLVYAQKHWGKLTLKQVMEPAIRLARDGFVLDYEEARAFHDSQLAKFPESHRIFQRDGDYYQRATSLSSRNWPRPWSASPKILTTSTTARWRKELAASIEKGGGLITADDLAQYEVKERQPIRGTYRGYEIISAPPPSSGGIALVESLNILEGYDLAKQGDRSAQSIHLTAEAFQRAFFDRAEFLGDPDFSKIPVAQLMDKRYGNAWRETIPLRRATPSAESAAALRLLAARQLCQLAPATQIHSRARPHHALFGSRSRGQRSFCHDDAE